MLTNRAAFLIFYFASFIWRVSTKNSQLPGEIFCVRVGRTRNVWIRAGQPGTSPGASRIFRYLAARLLCSETAWVSSAGTQTLLHSIWHSAFPCRCNVRKGSLGPTGTSGTNFVVFVIYELMVQLCSRLVTPNGIEMQRPTG